MGRRRCWILRSLLLCSHSPNDVLPEPQRNVSIAAVRGAVRPSRFYAHLLRQIFIHSDYDAMMVCVDMNSRIGQLSESIFGHDEIPNITILDQTTNQYCHTFIEFLNDAKFRILNGRMCPENDNYTSVST